MVAEARVGCVLPVFVCGRSRGVEVVCTRRPKPGLGVCCPCLCVAEAGGGGGGGAGGVGGGGGGSPGMEAGGRSRHTLDYLLDA